MDKTDRLRDYGLAFLLYEQGLGLCGYELIRELFIFIKLILNSYLTLNFVILTLQFFYSLLASLYIQIHICHKVLVRANTHALYKKETILNLFH